MHPAVLRRLRCPVCAAAFAGTDPPTGADRTAGPPALRCPHGHSFDLARQGYVNLLTGRARHPGDSAEMVAARMDFLAAGHYDVIAAALVEAARRAAPADAARHPASPPGAAPELVLDAGAGTGWYLARVLDALPGAVGLALDVSKPAVRRAARAHPRGAAALADLWRPLPLADDSTSLLLNVFAPRNGPEFHRVLRPDGVLLVVTPAEEHLAELVDALGLLRVDPAKQDRVAESLAGRFTPDRVTEHRATLTLPREQVRTLVGMGPSARHLDPDQLTDRLAALAEPVTVTVAVRLGAYRPR